MHVVVTGGAGFIGSHFVRHALATDADVRVTTLDALTYAGDRWLLSAVAEDPRHRFVHGDVRDAAVVADVVGDADAVAHFAAESHVDRSIDGPAAFLETNVLGTGVVLDACRRAGVPRVLHVSTDEVYGTLPTGSAAEDAPLQPNSPYAASKAAADLLVRSYARTYASPVVVTRATNTYGPGQLPEKLIPLFITTLLDGGDVPLYGDGGNVREWTYVADTVTALWSALTSGVDGGIYNVGSGARHTNRELTMALLSRFGLEGDAAQARIRHVADRPGHDLRYAVDATRIRSLGWSPRWTLDAGLDATVEWYRANEAWWRGKLDDGVAQRRGSVTT